MPLVADYNDFFGLDYFVGISLDNSPRYPVRVVEETAEYVTTTTPWGVMLRNWKHIASTPEFIDFTVIDPETWQKAKERMTPDPDRIPWEVLKAHYKEWRQGGAWIEAGLWFGFDVTHSWMVGTERLLMALIEQPDWCVEMFNHFLDVDLSSPS